MTESPQSLLAGFLATVDRYPSRIAVEVDGIHHDYARLHARAATLAATLNTADASPSGPPLTAIFASRSLTAYAGVLATFMLGRGYVPVNPHFPAERCRVIIERAQCAQIIVDARAAEEGLDAILADIHRPLTILVPDLDEIDSLAARWPLHNFLGARDLVDHSDFEPRFPLHDDIACLLFTSGSTGIPKGVMVAQRNVAWFCDVMRTRYEIEPNDRFTQLFEMTFDLSMFDMFMPWLSGACLCVPSHSDSMMLGRFILESAPTIWFSVPSFAILMKRMRLLEPDYYPSLRLSLFCGEALPMDITQAWAAAAANSAVENLYGPTELTIACTAYRWNSTVSPPLCERGVVPIGEPNAGMSAVVVDDRLGEVASGESGELLMTGPQLTLGYWQDPEQTAAAFVRPPGKNEIYYRTGDLVRANDGGPMTYLGRLDSQIQVRGYRVELSEVEAAIKDAAGADTAVALGWPVGESTAEAVVAFVQAAEVDEAKVIEQVRARLPAYMVPKEVRAVAHMPLNANGKVDRKALAALLDVTPGPG